MGFGEEEPPEGGELPLMGDDVPEGGDLPLVDFGEEEDSPEGGDLPLMGDDVPDGGDLPLMDFGDDGDAAELPSFAELPSWDESPTPEAVDAVAEAIEEERATPEAAPADADAAFFFDPPAAPAEEPVADEPAAAETRDPRAQYEAMAARAAQAPLDVELRQRMLEVAYLVNDDQVLAGAYLGLAHALREAGKDAKAQAMYQQVLSVDPENAEATAALEASRPATRPISEVTASEEYVDLGSLIFDDEEEKTTRFTVAYEEPSGDEDADFAKMLSQFKAKVAENFDAGDVKGHHDLGTAYKEMGLLDEAIEEFQQALRASANHLPTYELLGQTFMDKGEFDAAARVLKRALDADWEVEDELVGIYYYLGRAHEELSKPEEAAEFYDRVFSLDINFADVTERLRKLR